MRFISISREQQIQEKGSGKHEPKNEGSEIDNEREDLNKDAAREINARWIRFRRSLSKTPEEEIL